jgi:hypothetical protein
MTHGGRGLACVVGLLVIAATAGCSPAARPSTALPQEHRSLPGATSPTPTSSSLSSSTSVTLAPTDLAKCNFLPAEPPYYSLVGWRAGRVILLSITSLGCSMVVSILSVDPVGGSTRPEGVLPSPAASAYTDGHTIAAPFTDGDNMARILVIDPTGRQRLVTPPAAVAGGIVPLPNGGYLLAGSRELIRMASDGSTVATQALPAGYNTIAPTSDPDRFILVRSSDAEQAQGAGPAPQVHLALWDRVSGNLVAIGLGSMAEAGTGALAYVLGGPAMASPTSTWTTRGTWSSVGGSGQLTPVAEVTGRWSALAPDGQRLVSVSEVGSDALTDTVVVSALPSQTTVARYTPPTGALADAAAWDGHRAAILIQSQLPRTASPEIMIVDGTQVQHLALP